MHHPVRKNTQAAGFSNGKNPIKRILDANINRAKEGLRVCEEITRFLLNNRNLTKGFKEIRHAIDLAVRQLPGHSGFLKERKVARDVGKGLHIGELKRRTSQDIFFANMQRVKESLRVLEEFAKLTSVNCALKFKQLRYQAYELEKNTAKNIWK
jgi:thiamine-phosphate pyrophosphorylase